MLDAAPFALDPATDGAAVIPLIAMQDFGGGNLVEQGIGGSGAGDLARAVANASMVSLRRD